MGTNFSVKAAIRFTPPRKMKAHTQATSRPMTHLGTPKAVWKASPMELD